MTAKTVKSLARVLAAAAAIVAMFSWSALRIAAAQTPDRCPEQFLPLLASVDISEPAAGAIVTGMVTVRGTTSAAVPLNWVVLKVGGDAVDGAPLPGDTGEQTFELEWDASKAQPGPATLSIQACGEDSTVIPQLVGGEASVGVVVRAADSGTSTTVASLPSTGPRGSTVPGEVGAAPTPTTVAADVGARQSGSTSTVAPPSSTTVAPADESPATTEPVRARRSSSLSAAPAGPPGPGSLTLTDDSEDSSPGPPIWVGIVVGVSGTVGLLLSALVRRSHSSADTPDREPDPDLVEVG